MADDLQQMNSADHVLVIATYAVDRVYKPKCEETSLNSGSNKPIADPGGGAPRSWPPPNAKLARPNYVLASPKPASGFT